MKSFGFSLAIFGICAVTGLLPRIARAGTITTATSLSSFAGEEPSQVTYDPTTQTFSPNTTFNTIVDEGGGEFKFQLRYDPPNFWDGDRTTTETDRQRAEVKGLGPDQDLYNTFEYSFEWETDPNYIGTGSFCHIFQLKAINGDDSPPLVTLSLGSNDKGDVELWSPDGTSITDVANFNWTPNTWITTSIMITTSLTNTGSVMASFNGGAFEGVNNVPVYLTDSTIYRPKWGLYRGINSDLYVGTNYIQDMDITADAIAVPEPAGAILLAAGAALALARRPRKRTLDGV